MNQHRGKFTEGLVNTQIVLKSLNVQPGQTILDAGCGSGYMSKVFSDAVFESGKVYALDPDHYFIEILKHEVQGTNIEAMIGDITVQTELKPSSLDILYLSTVIHGFSKEQMQGFFREANRLLKPDALLAIVEIEKKKTPFGPPLKLRYSPEDLKNTIPMIPGDTVGVGEHFYMQIFKTGKMNKAAEGF